MPVLSVGGMRFQQSWSDLPADQITLESQASLRATLQQAVAAGFHHIETARHYGTSERQLGWLLPDAPDPKRIHFAVQLGKQLPEFLKVAVRADALQQKLFAENLHFVALITLAGTEAD